MKIIKATARKKADQMKNKVYISNDQKIIPTDRALYSLIRRAIKAALEFEDFQRECEVSVTLVDNAQIHEMNLESRGVDRPTDVLSFPMFDEDFDDGEMAILGDIVLSLEKAKSQAEEYGHSFEREVAFLTVHSVLHLLGYDHELSEEDEKDMFFRQEEILKIMKLER